MTNNRGAFSVPLMLTGNNAALRGRPGLYNRPTKRMAMTNNRGAFSVPLMLTGDNAALRGRPGLYNCPTKRMAMTNNRGAFSVPSMLTGNNGAMDCVIVPVCMVVPNRATGQKDG